MKQAKKDDKEQSKINDIQYKLVKEWSIDQIVELYKAGGWWKDHYHSSGISIMITGSFAFFVAVDKNTGNAVGMGRAISDGVSDAYIQDIVVLKDYRGKGIGKEIVQNLLNYCLEKNLVWIGLVAEPGTREFYSPLGFKKLPGEPLVYQPKQDSED